jgi:hypothetical protein
MKGTNYIQNGKNVRVAYVDKISGNLPPGNYSIEFSQMSGFSLNTREDFTMPPKIYGGSVFPDRVVDTFTKLGRGMSVLLSGPKGTGKTVEAKKICMISNMPVILVTDGFEGPEFKEFIESIKTPCVIFIDEFEKVYSDGSRNEFLSIMDGVAKSRHLFVLTSNEENIGEFFTNRPGRVRYHKRYEFASDEVIEEVVNDKLINTAHKDDVIQILNKLGRLSIDVITSLVEECNLHNESPKNFIEFFNVAVDKNDTFNLKLIFKAYVPKTGLSVGDYSTAVSLCEKVLQNISQGYDQHKINVDELNRYCDEIDVIQTAMYTHLQLGDNMGEIPRYIETYNFTRCNNPDIRTIGVDWLVDNIASFEESRSGFKATSRNGAAIIGIAVRKSKGSLFNF